MDAALRNVTLIKETETVYIYAAVRVKDGRKVKVYIPKNTPDRGQKNG